MFVTCSTLCFGAKPLEEVFASMVELQFQRYELILDENGPHLKPSAICDDFQKACNLLKSTPGLIPSAFTVYLRSEDPSVTNQQLIAICKLARHCAVPVINIPASPIGTSIEMEIIRFREIVRLAASDGILVNLIMEQGTLGMDPQAVIRICREIKDLGVCLDPSLEVVNPGIQMEDLYKFARHLHIRDTGKGISQYQVRIGQGQVDFGKIIHNLEKCNYKRALSIDIQDQPEISFQIEPEIRKLKFLLESMN